MDVIKEVRTEQEEPAPEKKGGKKKKKKGFFSIFYKDDGSRNNMAILAGIASAFLEMCIRDRVWEQPVNWQSSR